MFPEYEQAITSVDWSTNSGILYPFVAEIGIEIFFDNKSCTIVPPIPLPPRPHIKIFEIEFFAAAKLDSFPILIASLRWFVKSSI